LTDREREVTVSCKYYEVLIVSGIFHCTMLRLDFWRNPIKLEDYGDCELNNPHVLFAHDVLIKKEKALNSTRDVITV
jgi:hypothetical protein